MVTLVISDINKSIGPGDIVGAFINEAGASSNNIGKILKIQLHAIRIRSFDCRNLRIFYITPQGDSP